MDLETQDFGKTAATRYTLTLRAMAGRYAVIRRRSVRGSRDVVLSWHDDETAARATFGNACSVGRSFEYQPR